MKPSKFREICIFGAMMIYFLMMYNEVRTIQQHMYYMQLDIRQIHNFMEENQDD